MDNVTVDLGLDSGVARRRAGDPARRRRGRADRGRGDRGASGHDQLRDHLRRSARVSRANTTVTASRDERGRERARARARRCCAGSTAGSSAGRCATSCWAAPPSIDLDLVIAGEVAPAARALARAAGAAARSRSPMISAPGASVARGARWQADLNPLRGASLEADLLLRDFTINAIAQAAARRRADRPARPARATSPTRRLRIVAPAALERRPAAGAAARAAGLRARSRSRRRRHAQAAARGRTRARANLERAGLRGASASDRERARRRRHAPGAGARALRGRACRSSSSCAAWSRATTTTSTRSITRSPCSTASVELQRDAGGVSWQRARRGRARPARASAGRRADARRRAALRRAGARHRQVTDHGSSQPTGASASPGMICSAPRRRAAILARLRAAERIRAHVAALTRNHLRLGFLVRARAAVSAASSTTTSTPASRSGLTSPAVGRRPRGDARRALGGGDPAPPRTGPLGDRGGAALAAPGTPAGLCCAAMSWRPRSGSRPGRCWASCSGEIEQEAFVGELRSPQDAIAFAAARIA